MMNKKISKFISIALTIGLCSGIAKADWRDYFSGITGKQAAIIGGVGVGTALTAQRFMKKRHIKQMHHLLEQVKLKIKELTKQTKYSGFFSDGRIHSGPFRAIINGFSPNNDYTVSIQYSSTFKTFKDLFTQGLMTFLYGDNDLNITIIIANGKVKSQSLEIEKYPDFYQKFFPNKKLFSDTDLTKLGLK